MFSCKVCIEKELRISELKDQIQYFKTVLHPEPRINKYEMETDFIQDGGGREQLNFAAPISEEARAEQQKKIDEIQQEQDRILSGTY